MVLTFPVAFWQQQNQGNPDILQSGLLADFKFNNKPNSSLLDSSGNSWNGTLVNSPTWLSSNVGLSFDGTNDHITLPARNFGTLSEFYIEVFVMIRSYNNWSRIVDFANGDLATDNHIYLAASNATSGNLTLGILEGSFATFLTYTAQPLPLNTYLHLSAGFSGGVGYIYFSGDQETSGALPTPANITRSICYIGRSQFSSDGYLNANVGRIAFYNRLLTQTERDSNYTIISDFAETNGLIGTRFLSYFEGTDGSTSITEDSGLTINNVGSPIISTTQFYQGSSSLYLNGSSYIRTNFLAELDILGGDFQIEGFFYFTSLANYPHLFQLSSSASDGNRCTVYLHSSGAGGLRFFSNTSGSALDRITSPANPITINTWTYICLYKKGKTIGLKINNTLVGTSKALLPRGNMRLTIGMNDVFNSVADYFYGYIDAFRVTGGRIRNIDSVPTLPY